MDIFFMGERPDDLIEQILKSVRNDVGPVPHYPRSTESNLLGSIRRPHEC